MPTDLSFLNSFPHLETNCFGAVVLFFKGMNKPRWIESKELKFFLKHNATKDKKLSKNCVYAMYCPNTNELIHTAVYLGSGIFLHKPGSLAPELITKQSLHSLYKEKECLSAFGKKYNIVFYKMKKELKLAFV